MSICAAAPVVAQGGRAALELNIVDASTGQPVPGVRVEVTGQHRAAQTDGRGVAVLRGIPAGPQYVKVLRMGYEASGVALQFSPGDSLALDVNLAPASVALDPVVARVTATAARLRAHGFYDRQNTGFGKFATEREIGPHANQPLYVALQTLTGVSVATVNGAEHSGNLTEHWVYSPRSLASGMKQCYMTIYLDGVRQTSYNLDDIPTEILGAMEVYTSASQIPAEYNATGSGCGVVLLWTKSGY
ncbi:MAG TPA: carboxypeptidase regulatory-like domain-containing protein [Longimicrobiaceae bacterium]|nr:carboxypeptidase regulatory-like domain-containing protein [Longimicrobiaceae bacterium]